MHKIATIIILLFANYGFAQQDSLQINKNELIFFNVSDSTAVVNLDSIVILPKIRFNNYYELKKYRWIRRKIYKVYPFAKMAGENLVKLDSRLNNLKNKRQKKRYLKIIQRWIQKELEPQLSKLTQSEGRFLSKLVYRQTGSTVFSLLKKYKSGWTAFWYQQMARLYNVNLKVKFDPVNNKEDYWIEDILQRAFSDEILVPQPNKLGYKFIDLHNKWKPVKFYKKINPTSKTKLTKQKK